MRIHSRFGFIATISLCLGGVQAHFDESCAQAQGNDELVFVIKSAPLYQEYLFVDIWTQSAHISFVGSIVISKEFMCRMPRAACGAKRYRVQKPP